MDPLCPPHTPLCPLVHTVWSQHCHPQHPPGAVTCSVSCPLHPEPPCCSAGSRHPPALPREPRWSSTHRWSLGHPTAHGITAGKRGTRWPVRCWGWGWGTPAWLTRWGARCAGSRRPVRVLGASAAPGVVQRFPFLPRRSTPVLDGEQKPGWQGGHGAEQQGGRSMAWHGTAGWARTAPHGAHSTHTCPRRHTDPKTRVYTPSTHGGGHVLTHPHLHVCTLPTHTCTPA